MLEIGGDGLSTTENCRCPRPTDVAIILPCHLANRDVHLRKEALAIMQSSATVALRAFVMLACAVGIPVLAMSGASWSEILKKFQNLRWPAVVEFGFGVDSARGAVERSASVCAAESGRRNRHVRRSIASRASPTLARAVADPSPDAAGTAKTSSDVDDIPKRLQQLGATYYVLESWGNDQQLYRFYCKMAVAENADYTHCFEATDADPRQAMQQRAAAGRVLA